MNNKINQLDFFEEPLLEFANKQKSDYCKDGLFLYGPLVSKPDISYGIIGHKEGIERFEKWMKDIQNFIPAKDNDKLHFSPFIGFNPIFNTNFRLVNNAKILINQEDINKILNKTNGDKIEFIMNGIEVKDIILILLLHQYMIKPIQKIKQYMKQ